MGLSFLCVFDKDESELFMTRGGGKARRELQ